VFSKYDETRGTSEVYDKNGNHEKDSTDFEVAYYSVIA
jgi:hypothetical protein